MPHEAGESFLKIKFCGGNQMDNINQKHSVSINRFAFSKQHNEEWTGLRIKNDSEIPKSFKLNAYDANTNEALSIFSGNNEILETTVAPANFIDIKIDSKKVENKIAVEFSGQSGSVGIRRNSSSKDKTLKPIEFILK